MNSHRAPSFRRCSFDCAVGARHYKLGERLFTYRTADSIPDLPIHRKLKIAQKGSQYVNGKNDLFSVVIALRYMLNDQWYKEFIKELKALIDKYLKKHDSISEQELYEKMGFPENWRKITRYRKQ